jgi:hypothetical protein
MNFPPRILRWNGAPGVAFVVSMLVLTGCHRDETKVYHVDRDSTDTAQPTQASPAETPPPQTAEPPVAPTTPEAQLSYQAPAGWQKKPLSQMRVASLTAPGPDGQTGDVSVIPLPVVGRDLDLINLWRSQVKLPPTSDPNAVKQAKPVAIGSDEGRLFKYVSEVPMIGQSRQQILVATLARGDQTWFFRIVGPDRLVNAQKKNFLAFLKSVSFTESAAGQTVGTAPDMAAPADTAAAPPAPDDNSPATWTVPPDWQPTPPAQFLLAEYAISGPGGAKAKVNVAELKGEGGGLSANVNRWRDQIGLAPLDDDEVAKQAQPLDVPSGTVSMVDFTGVDAETKKPTRLIGAMVEQEGHAWFYKLMGDPPAVARQRGAFTKFIQSAHYANAR